MNMEEVIENELKCVQRNCCRLENECAKCDLVLPIEEIINAYNEALRIKKENAELLCQKNRNKSCYSCANATERCFRNEIGCPCQKYKSYTEENAELKKKILDTQDAVTMQMYMNKANKEIADRQLTKAKELLNEFMRISKASDEDFEHDFSELIGEAEQFLKEVKE